MDEKESQMLIEKGEKVSTELMGQLASALMTAMQEGGATNAIDVCKLEALRLTESIARQNPGTQVKRTSLKFRNPKNAPDHLEQVALTHFEQLAAKGEELPHHLLQKVQEEDTVYYRYYQPLKTMSFCLTCHGSPEPELAEILKKRYPEDRAVGYNAGEFRGLIRVQVDQF
jgi:hypothetical protein